MNAKEMFEKLGFESKYVFMAEARYVRKEKKMDFIPNDNDKQRVIEFRYGFVDLSYAEYEPIYKPLSFQLKPEEHLAIHQQMVELGWIEK